MAMKAPESNVKLKKLLQDAKNGVHSALDSLEALSIKDKRALQQFLPILSEILQSPHPATDCNLGRGVYQNEYLAGKAILAMVRCGTDSAGMISLVETFFLEHITHILRWMEFLFEKWVFQRWRFSGQFFSTIPKEHVGVHMFRAHTQVAISNSLRLMVGSPTVCDMLTKYSSVGTIVAQIFLVANRSKDNDLLEVGIMAYTLLGKRWKERKAGRAFFRYLEFRSEYFAEHIVSLIKEYSQPTPMDHAHKLYYVLLHLLHCTNDHDILLDACLEQGGVIHALMSILLSAVDWLQHCKRFESDAQKDSVSIVFIISETLCASFVRGGPALIATALDHDLLDAVLRLRKLVAAEHIGNSTAVDHSRIQNIGISLSLLIEAIIPSVVYPTVMKKAVNFASLFKPLVIPGLSNKAPDLQNALEGLTRRIGEELKIIVKERATSKSLNYPDPYKYCDNTECPTKTLTKLGRCTGCSLAYYCSRSCQKIGWKTGHYTECRSIAASIADGREGFPPVMAAHDDEYLNKMAASHFQFYYNTQCTPSPDHFTERDVFKMDLSTYPVEITLIDRAELGVDNDNAPDNPFYGKPGPFLLTKHPGCTKLNPEGPAYRTVTTLGLGICPRDG